MDNITPARIEKVAKLQREGKTEQEIITQISEDFANDDYNAEMLAKDMQQLLDRWHEFKNQDIEYVQMQEYYKRKDLLELTKQMFELSCKPRVKRTVTTVKQRNKTTGEMEVKEERVAVEEASQTGNMALLQIMAGLIREQGEILGLTEKIKHNEEYAAITGNSMQIEETKSLIESLRPSNYTPIEDETEETEERKPIENADDIFPEIDLAAEPAGLERPKITMDELLEQ